MDPTAPVDSITCRNKGAFVLKCHVKWRVGDGPITQSDYSSESPRGPGADLRSQRVRHP
jgi:hypothetical protein